jgi:hypothetical protein
MPEPLRYLSGHEIREGDRVRFRGLLAQIEFSASDPNDPQHAWFVRQYGGGVMVREASVSGLTFIPVDQRKSYEDLEFITHDELEASP